MKTIDSFGFIEVYGLVAGIEAADAMLKSAQVRLLRQHEVRPGMITLVVEGDLAACRAAVNAGVAAASRVGTVLGSHVIGRPVEDTESMVLDLASRSLDDYTGQSKPSKPRKVKAEPVKAEAAKVEPVKTESVKAEPVKVEAAKAEPVKAATAKASPPAKPKAKPQTPPPVEVSSPAMLVNELEKALEFILSAPKGRSWSEVAKRFPKHSPQLQAALDACVESGSLSKPGARYRKPAAKE